MATVDITATPTPNHLTLLFKHGKSTTLLSILPDQEFSEVRALLLAALRARNLTTLPGSTITLPDDPDDLELGKLVDRKDASKGWTVLEDKDEISSVKSGKQKASSKKHTSTNTPASAGLSDGSWIAYRVKKPVDDSDMEVPDIEMETAEGWNVILPTFDDEAEDVET